MFLILELLRSMLFQIIWKSTIDRCCCIVTFGPYTGTSPVEISVVGDDVNCDKYITVLSACQACVPTGINCTFGDGFLGLVIADIDNSDSGCSTDGYGIFPELTTDLAQGATYPVAVTTGYSSQYVRAWIDFNDDYEFSLDELIIDNVLSQVLEQQKLMLLFRLMQT